MSTLPFIDQQRNFHFILQLCQVLDVVLSRYYAGRHRSVAGVVERAEPAWETEMVAVFDDHKRRYGTRRLRVELRELGHRVGRQALRTGLRRHGRKALQPKAFVPRTTDSTHRQRCAPNLVGGTEQYFLPNAVKNSPDFKSAFQDNTIAWKSW